MIGLSFGNEAGPQNITRRGDRTQGSNKIRVTGFFEDKLLGQRLRHDNVAGLLPSGFRGSKTSFVKIDDEVRCAKFQALQYL
jgi:hypothetical protein